MEETRKTHPNGDTYCSVCKYIRSREAQKKYPERQKEYYKRTSKRRLYNLEPDDYKKLVDSCDNKCMICGDSPKIKSLNVDHNHETGEIRGLLCHGCNIGIGLLKEDLNIMKSAMKYLLKSNKKKK